MRNLLAKQNEENAELNKDLPEKIKKIEETVKIHAAKPKRTEGQHDEDDDFESVEEKKRGEHGRRGGRGGRGTGRGGRGGFGRENGDHVEGRDRKNSNFNKGEVKHKEE